MKAARSVLINCTLRAGTVVQAPVLLQREEESELKRGKVGHVGLRVFSRVEAALRALETAQATCEKDGELLRLLERDVIPRTVMDCADIVLHEGTSSHTVRTFFNTSGYDKLLTTDRKSDPELKRRIFFWKAVPWLYRA